MLFVVGCLFAAYYRTGAFGCCQRVVYRKQEECSIRFNVRPTKSRLFKTFDLPRLARSSTTAATTTSATFEQQSLEIIQIKKHLRKMLSHFINLYPQRRRIFALIRGLEGRYSPPSCWEPMMKQLQGSWNLVFSSTTLGVPSSELVVVKVTQTLGIGKWRENGCFEIDMLNKCQWNYVQQGAYGELDIFCMLTFLGKCRFMCRVLDYRMETHDQVNTKEAQSIIGYLQRNLPREFFDPNNCMLQITFVDDEIRIVKWLGKRFAGVRNIFYRCQDEEKFPIS